VLEPRAVCLQEMQRQIRLTGLLLHASTVPANNTPQTLSGGLGRLKTKAAKVYAAQDLQSSPRSITGLPKPYSTQMGIAHLHRVYAQAAGNVRNRASAASASVTLPHGLGCGAAGGALSCICAHAFLMSGVSSTPWRRPYSLRHFLVARLSHFQPRMQKAT